MKKRLLSFITLLCTLGATVSPAWADDPQQASPVAAASPTATAPSTTPTPTPAAAPKTLGGRLASWPICIAGFACGTVVGTPICFIRKLPSEVKNLAHGFVGSITDKESMWLLIPAGIAWLPFSATAALMEAPAYAWKDAYMAEKPFSKEQFSLGEIDAPDKK